MILRLQPRTILRLLVTVVSFLIAAHLGVRLLAEFAGRERMEVFTALFHLNMEANIPTWYSSLTLLLASALLALIALHERRNAPRYKRHWALLSLMFLYLAIDETAMIHEAAVGSTIRRAFHTTGAFYQAWVIPAGVVVAALAVWCWDWLFSLPSRTRRLAIVSALIYVTGALGLEMVEGALAAGNAVRFGSLATTAEEVLEMLGVALWIYVLSDYAAARRYGLTLAFGEANLARPHPPDKAAGAAHSADLALR